MPSNFDLIRFTCYFQLEKNKTFGSDNLAQEIAWVLQLTQHFSAS